MYRSSILLLGILGCAESADPAQKAAPPQLTLAIEGAMENARSLTFIIDGAAPGQQVYLVHGSNIGSTCPPQLTGTCLDVDDARLLNIPQNPVRADANGHASVMITVPNATVVPNDTIAWFQAITPGNVPTTSNTVSKVNPRARGAFELLVEGELRQTAAGVEGTYRERYVSLRHDLDLCVIEYDVSTVPNQMLPHCQGCSFELETFNTSPVERQSSGDCGFFFNLHAAQLVPYSGSIALHPSFAVPGGTSEPTLMQYSQGSQDWVPIYADFSYANGVLHWTEHLGATYY